MLRLLLPVTCNAWLLSFTIVTLGCTVTAYNLDTENAKVFSCPTRLNQSRGSYFGFSVALVANSNESVVLVGAPRANITTLLDVVEPGTIYQCPINNTCKEWVIDKSGNGRNKKYGMMQIKDNAWTGATIAVENKTDPRVVVCAPRWKNNIITRNRPNWFMNGFCYWTVADSEQSFTTEAQNIIAPLINTADQIISLNGRGIYNFGMGQAGFSLYMTSNELRWNVLLGSPGVHNWKGTSVLVTKSLYGRMQTVVPSVEEEVRVHSGDYFGYTVTSGSYFKKGDIWYASGAPRAANMNGNVIIFSFPYQTNKKLLVKAIVSGEQHGEYFGAALASCDLNNDGRDDLIVGAPQWAKDMDEGRIYVFIGRDGEVFQKQLFEGETPGGKFGSAITCLGDIDYDGYGDIAVSAPYEEEHGAIYIFNGNINGLPKQYSQKIMGSSFGESIRGFGISISEPRDINGDNYPDIAVGAYLSEHAILLKSKPVVTITTKLAYVEKKKLLTNSTFFVIDTCTAYDGIYAPEMLHVVRHLKVDKMYGRATFDVEKSNDNTYKLPGSLLKSKLSCETLKINLKKNIQNIIDPLEISVSVSLEEELEVEPKEPKTDIFCTTCAVINKLLSKTEDMIKLPFAVDCGEDNVCTSDIEVALTTNLKSNRYVIGSTSTVQLVINTYNHGEPAYQAKVYAYIPTVLTLASVPLECIESSTINNTLEVICDVGNPLRRNETLVLELDMSAVRFNIDNIELWANVTTQSEENVLSNNIHHLTMYFDADVDLAIAGKAQEDLYSYFHKNGEQLDSIRFQHIYEVQKFGASPIEEAILTVNIPVYWKHSAGDVEIININQTIGYMDGQQFYCEYLNYTSSTSSSSEISEHITYSKVMQTHEKFTIEENPIINVPPANRSLYINCTNVAIECKQLQCILGPFLSSLSVAKLSIILDLHLLNFTPNMMERKDIIFFLTEGSVNITEPYNIIQKSGHKPDNTIVGTTFLGSPIAQQIATWIIAVSIFLGIMLLVLLILGLVKVGFFNRKKKEELEALKAETNKNHEIILETSSSREVLDQE